MFSFEKESMLTNDREDLITVLQLRFGMVPGEVIEKIYEISDASILQGLILAAANAHSYQVFLEELNVGEKPFRLVGEEFNPLYHDDIRRDA